MKTFKTALISLALVASMQSQAAPALTGVWKTVSGTDKALSGKLAILKDGSAELSPEGFDPLKGTWGVKGHVLTLTMPPHGQSSMNYSFTKKGELKLNYENGLEQVFAKTASAVSNTKARTTKRRKTK
jgi:hypothetical protein